jgi:hypothetical protein
MPAAVLVELALRLEGCSEARERAEQRVDLVERVLAPLGGGHLEPEADLLGAVADPQANAWLGRALPPAAAGGVLDEDANARTAVVAGEVEDAILVDPHTGFRGAVAREAPGRIVREVRHSTPPFGEDRGREMKIGATRPCRAEVCCGREMTAELLCH